MSKHLGQYSLTACFSGVSEIPVGINGEEWHPNALVG